MRCHRYIFFYQLLLNRILVDLFEYILQPLNNLTNHHMPKECTLEYIKKGGLWEVSLDYLKYVLLVI